MIEVVAQKTSNRTRLAFNLCGNFRNFKDVIFGGWQFSFIVFVN
jgi:hypothetical protein